MSPQFFKHILITQIIAFVRLCFHSLMTLQARFYTSTTNWNTELHKMDAASWLSQCSLHINILLPAWVWREGGKGNGRTRNLWQLNLFQRQFVYTETRMTHKNYWYLCTVSGLALPCLTYICSSFPLLIQTDCPGCITQVDMEYFEFFCVMALFWSTRYSCLQPVECL